MSPEPLQFPGVPLAAAYNAVHAEMQLNQRAQAGALLPPVPPRPPSTAEVLSEMYRQRTTPATPQTPAQQQANWDFLRSGVGIPGPNGLLVPSTSATAPSPFAWADRHQLSSVITPWISPNPALPITEVVPSYQPLSSVAPAPAHVGTLGFAYPTAEAPHIGTVGFPSEGRTKPSGMEVSQIPDPVAIVQTNDWPSSVVFTDWTLPKKVAWLQAIMHPYLVFPFWRERLGQATGLLYQQEAAKGPDHRIA